MAWGPARGLGVGWARVGLGVKVEREVVAGGWAEAEAAKEVGWGVVAEGWAVVEHTVGRLRQWMTAPGL